MLNDLIEQHYHPVDIIFLLLYEIKQRNKILPDMLCRFIQIGNFLEKISATQCCKIILNLCNIKTLVVALQMAKYSLLEKHKGYQPILLLDDIMDKLDEERMQKLINLVARQKVGQVFITDAHPDRIKQYYNSLNVPKKFIQIDNAEIIYEETGKII